MRVFLTGAPGFIGSHVARALLEEHDVIAYAKPGDPLWRLQEVADQLIIRRGFLSDEETLRAILQECRPEACIHLAWYAEPGKYLHSTENLAALAASLVLLNELADAGCKQIVAAGTCAEYDAGRGFLREEGPTRPETLYAAAKLSLCLMGEQLCAANGMSFAWARVFYPYGPAEDQRRVVPALIRALRNDTLFPATAGEQVRDYLHVEDVASALLVLMDRRAHGVFNIASGVPVTMRQLMGTIGELLGRGQLIQFGALPYRDWEPMFICGDNRRLKGLGWIPRYTLDEGLKQTCRWWLEHLA